MTEKKYDNEELRSLLPHIRNTLNEAIGVMEAEGAYMLEVKKDPSWKKVNYLVKSRMNLLHQKNKLKELHEKLFWFK